MLTLQEVKGEDLEFIIESVHFIQADNHVGFYALFILWCCAADWPTEYIFFLEMKQGVCLPNQLERTASLLVMVNVMKGGGRAPPTLTSLA